ncbi:MAG: RNA polymerase sigma factor [Azospirillaceae bacterium]
MQRLGREAWQKFVAAGPDLRRFALALTRDEGEADDLVQATYERALARLDQWRGDGEIAAWLFAIMQSIQRNEWRRRQRDNAARATLGALSIATVDGERVAAGQMTLSRVRRAIDTLPIEQRQALLAVVLDGLSYQAAADRLGLPLGTLTSRVARARQTVAAAASWSVEPEEARTPQKAGAIVVEGGGDD